MPVKVLCVMGTRPEVIKMAPVVKALEQLGLEAPILVTAQHRELLDQMALTFGLRPSWDLDAMKPNQTLAALTGTLVPALDTIIRGSGADAVLAQGDTTTVFCAALAAYYAGIPFGHVEAGLRSGDLRAPFPEEGMRRLASVLTRWHFAPSAEASAALLKEGFRAADIHLTGNTVIDSLLEMARRPDLPWPQVPPPRPGRRLVLITLHRRENFGEPFRRILSSIRAFALAHAEADLVYPVHPNPNVLEPAREMLGGLTNVTLTRPMDYPELINVMKNSYMIFTDSGGIQEEGPALGIPVLIFREVTERPEAVASGGAVLVGSDPIRFRQVVGRLWEDPSAYTAMAVPRFPYGRGDSGLQIARILQAGLGGSGGAGQPRAVPAAKTTRKA